MAQTPRTRICFVNGYRAGLQAASSQNKPMLLFFTAEWCHFCHQLASEAFNDAGVIGLADRFVCVTVDADREPEVCRYFRVQSYPTIQFVSASGQVLNRMVGKRPRQELIRQMHVALQMLAQADDVRAMLP
jgi:thioredoxin-like negative regulator of GroEL